MPRPDVRTFYRIVAGPVATEADFLPASALGRPAPTSGGDEALRMWQGVSVVATIGQARAKVRGAPLLGDYIAELAIPEDGPIAFARTGGRRARGHHTL